MSRLPFPWNPSFWHLFSSPNLLQLVCTFDILSKYFFIVIVIIIEECMLWTIKQFPSTATTLLSQPLCISSRHYTSTDQWCHPVERVVSNTIMWYLDIMKCMWVLGLVPWFWCIVSLHLSSKCLLPNERVVWWIMWELERVSRDVLMINFRGRHWWIRT